MAAICFNGKIVVLYCAKISLNEGCAHGADKAKDQGDNHDELCFCFHLVSPFC